MNTGRSSALGEKKEFRDDPVELVNLFRSDVILLSDETGNLVSELTQKPDVDDVTSLKHKRVIYGLTTKCTDLQERGLYLFQQGGLSDQQKLKIKKLNDIVNLLDVCIQKAQSSIDDDYIYDSDVDIPGVRSTNGGLKNFVSQLKINILRIDLETYITNPAQTKLKTLDINDFKRTVLSLATRIAEVYQSVNDSQQLDISIMLTIVTDFKSCVKKGRVLLEDKELTDDQRVKVRSILDLATTLGHDFSDGIRGQNQISIDINAYQSKNPNSIRQIIHKISTIEEEVVEVQEESNVSSLITEEVKSVQDWIAKTKVVIDSVGQNPIITEQQHIEIDELLEAFKKFEKEFEKYKNDDHSNPIKDGYIWKTASELHKELEYTKVPLVLRILKQLIKANAQELGLDDWELKDWTQLLEEFTSLDNFEEADDEYANLFIHAVFMFTQDDKVIKHICTDLKLDYDTIITTNHLDALISAAGKINNLYKSESAESQSSKSESAESQSSKSKSHDDEFNATMALKEAEKNKSKHKSWVTRFEESILHFNLLKNLKTSVPQCSRPMGSNEKTALKNKLDEECDKYANHLKLCIQKDLNKNLNHLTDQALESLRVLIGGNKTSLKQQQMEMPKGREAGIKTIVDAFNKDLESPAPGDLSKNIAFYLHASGSHRLATAIEKYNAVREMKQCNTVEEFNKCYNGHKALLVKQRDHAAIAFVKKVGSILATVLTAVVMPGVALTSAFFSYDRLFGDKSVRGRGFVKEIQKLQAPKQPQKSPKKVTPQEAQFKFPRK